MAQIDKDRWIVMVETVDTWDNNRRTKKFMRRADDVRQVATFSEMVARHVVANMTNDYRYNRHAVALEFNEFEIAMEDYEWPPVDNVK